MVGTRCPYVVTILEEGPAGVRAEVADVPGVVAGATRAELANELALAIERDFDRRGNAVYVEWVEKLRDLGEGREEHEFRLSPA